MDVIKTCIWSEEGATRGSDMAVHFSSLAYGAGKMALSYIFIDTGPNKVCSKELLGGTNPRM